MAHVMQGKGLVDGVHSVPQESVIPSLPSFLHVLLHSLPLLTCISVVIPLSSQPGMSHRALWDEQGGGVGGGGELHAPGAAQGAAGLAGRPGLATPGCTSPSLQAPQQLPGPPASPGLPPPGHLALDHDLLSGTPRSLYLEITHAHSL